METSYAPQKLAVETLDRSNKENNALKQQVRELDSWVADLIEEVEYAKEEVQSVGKDAVKQYIANFHLTKEY